MILFSREQRRNCALDSLRGGRGLDREGKQAGQRIHHGLLVQLEILVAPIGGLREVWVFNRGSRSREGLDYSLAKMETEVSAES